MAISININGLSLCHRGSGGVTVATAPDVCKTRGGVPLPFPNIAFSADLSGGTSTVSADGGHSVAVSGSSFCRSFGDELGEKGGVVSGTHQAEATWLTFSTDVTFEGQGACRLTDKMLHNRGNTINCSGEMQAPVPQASLIDPHCDSENWCDRVWQEAESLRDAVNVEDDPQKRNVVISAKYAQIYQAHPELYWAGTAAFASKQVGCGMAEAKRVGGGAGQIAAAIIAFPIFGPSGVPLGDELGEDAALHFLGKGNKDVFHEIYPVLLLYSAFKECGWGDANVLLDCLRDKGVHEDLVDAMALIIGGDAANGALMMLYHEQAATLQTTAYDYPSFQVMLRASDVFNIGDPSIALAAQCTADSQYTVEYSGGNLWNYDDRWPYAEKVANRFIELAQSDPDYINGQLDQIIEAAGLSPR